MSETPMIATPWTRLSSESAPPPNAVIELAKFPIQCGEQMPWLAIGMNLDGLDLRDVFLGATHWRLAPQRRQELTVGVPADEIARLQSRIEELETGFSTGLAEIKDELNGLAMMGAVPMWGSLIGRLDDLAVEVLNPTEARSAANKGGGES